MIFLIAESGATKTAWRVCTAGETIAEFYSMGFNPNSTDSDAWLSELKQIRETHLNQYAINQFFYYGAGLRREADRKNVFSNLSERFPESDIFVEHDLTAAVRSCGRESGIVCILGTGSNACQYQNQQISLQLGGHGYLLGDQGSGMDLGKCLLRGILQEDFPTVVREYVEEKEKIDIFALRSKIYASPHPPRSLAKLARHLDELQHLEVICEMIVNRFLIFLNTTVCRIPYYQTFTADFIGGISHHFKDLLQIACKQSGVTWGRSIQHPIDELVKYHFKHTYSN